MFKAQTIEQFKIKQFLEQNFYPEGIRSIELLSRNTVRITDRDHETALIICHPGGTVELMAEDSLA